MIPRPRTSQPPRRRGLGPRRSDVAPATEPTVRVGLAGRSAQRQHDRLAATARRRRPLGALVAALRRWPAIGTVLAPWEPREQRAWADGARGERIVAAWLDAAGHRTDVVVLHDRAVPRSAANIDHLCVGPAGVHVIDTKHRRHGIVRAWPPWRPHLVLGRRRADDLVDGLGWQVRAVADVLTARHPTAVAVHGVLCIVGIPWRGRWPRTITGVVVGRPEDLAAVVGRPGPLDHHGIVTIARLLDRAFPPR